MGKKNKEWFAPEPRIGRKERDAAIERLREAYEDEVLNLAEFQDRMAKAMTTHFQWELDELLEDLPEPPPVPPPVLAPQWPVAPRKRGVPASFAFAGWGLFWGFWIVWMILIVIKG